MMWWCPGEDAASTIGRYGPRMSSVGQPERVTQNRVVKLLCDELGYEYLGNWEKRDCSNVEEEYLSAWLKARGYSEERIQRVLTQLGRLTAVGSGRDLYKANKETYDALRYGIQVAEAGEQAETVWLIDWKNPENNHFGVAEEVTVIGQTHTKRPDVVLYVNGIALGVIELKRSKVGVSEGIRQNLDNQKPVFIEQFFSTVQYVFAGNDTQGLRYGTIQTPENFYLEWKRDPDQANQLDHALFELCTKSRFLELIHDFIVFDAGIKKVCRHNQYFGVKAAQERVMQREGGVIWHTQGSGKSLTMVWLAKWIRENVSNARVLVVTDRTELDEQISTIFNGVNENIYRAKSGADLVNVLNSNKEALVCSLIHKFGRSEEGDIEEFLKDVEAHLPKGFSVKGELFVFIDECHRTQSGKLHAALKAILPNATLIGFTGTPLLTVDKAMSVSTFGSYIHTYKYKEAVKDGVVLDLRYEARDIPQKLDSPKKVDKWFEAKTRGLTESGRAQLKKRWGTMQNVLSAKSRLERIVADICLDMETRPRLSDGHGNAILVSDSIYNACRFYDLFQGTPLKGHCAIVTSYEANAAQIKGEATGEGETQAIQQYETYQQMLATWFGLPKEEAVLRSDVFEMAVKKKFIKEPGQLKLLIVVDKLLTGFDAPPATYLYIDKSMKDHGLFQAICRVNRLDEDKDYGYIIDYKDLFKSLEHAFTEYAGENGGAFDGYGKEDIEGLLKDRLKLGKERLDDTLDEVRMLCEGVDPSRTTQKYLSFFCTPENATEDEVAKYERRRVELYKATSRLARAYADIASELIEAKYSEEQAASILKEVEHYTTAAEEIRIGSGDSIDMKMYEPGMRHLLDQYIRAKESKVLTTFDDQSLVELLAIEGEKAIEKLPDGIKNDPKAVAETIANNVRKVIVDESAVNPKYYEKMSNLLSTLIKQLRQGRIDYHEYLKQVAALAKQIQSGPQGSDYPAKINTKSLQALYDNLGSDEDTALRVLEAYMQSRQDGWRGNTMKRRKVQRSIREVLSDDALTENMIELLAAQHGN